MPWVPPELTSEVTFRIPLPVTPVELGPVMVKAEPVVRPVIEIAWPTPTVEEFAVRFINVAAPVVEVELRFIRLPVNPVVTPVWAISIYLAELWLAPFAAIDINTPDVKLLLLIVESPKPV
jgi:hypothetical protein